MCSPLSLSVAQEKRGRGEHLNKRQGTAVGAVSGGGDSAITHDD
jgi:hypothetical protein